jgi:hypothetical protein
MKNSIEKSVKKFQDKKILNVFFITSPIVAIISKMIIQYFKIKRDNVLIISFRDTDLSLLLDYELLKIEQGKFDRYFEKLFFLSPSGSKIENKINTYNKDFIIFSPLALREVNWLVNIPKCLGHIYVEEGQHSYMDIFPYDPSNINFYDRLIKNWKNRFSEVDEIGYYFRNDCIGYIGLFPDVYPKISSLQKLILNNLVDLKGLYKPKLININTIGITCASRRLESSSIEAMLINLFSYLPNNSKVKAHPSFTSSQKVFNDFKKKFDKVSEGKFKLCTNDTILELEMLYEPKKLVGSKSSLSKYAKQLGSTYDLVKLY